MGKNTKLEPSLVVRIEDAIKNGYALTDIVRFLDEVGETVTIDQVRTIARNIDLSHRDHGLRAILGVVLPKKPAAEREAKYKNMMVNMQTHAVKEQYAHDTARAFWDMESHHRAGYLTSLLYHYHSVSQELRDARQGYALLHQKYDELAAYLEVDQWFGDSGKKVRAEITSKFGDGKRRA